MKRRKFIQFGAASGLGLSTGLTATSCLSSAADKEDSIESFSLAEKTISELKVAMQKGELTCEAITLQYLERIKHVDKAGPKINAILEINPDAIVLAQQLDAERKEGKIRGILHGIPVMLKDNIDTADKMKTTAGSLALLDSKPSNDAFLVKKLREAGALILGKTNLSEWANFRSERSSSGWSGRGGQTKNPYALNRNPCGSSSGSGVAVSANLCSAAVGTETDGSVVCPSGANGIVGIKPTVGLISRSGIIPISASQDTAGPMARTVTDAAMLLTAMTGADSADEDSIKAEVNIKPDYTAYLHTDSLNGARIGVARDRFGFHEGVDQQLELALKKMEEKGATLIDIESILNTKGIYDAEYTVLLYEFKDGIRKYLSTLRDFPMATLSDLITFNKANRETEMPYFQQEIFEMAQEKGDLTSQEYLDALALCRKGAREDGIDRIMDEHSLDAIVAPTNGPAWSTDMITGDHFLGGSSTAAAISGYPNITVPAGFVHKLPVGISFFGRAFSEDVLIGLAYSFEQISKSRQEPKFIPYI